MDAGQRYRRNDHSDKRQRCGSWRHGQGLDSTFETILSLALDAILETKSVSTSRLQKDSGNLVRLPKAHWNMVMLELGQR
jgi:hypothetical protein